VSKEPAAAPAPAVAASEPAAVAPEPARPKKAPPAVPPKPPGVVIRQAQGKKPPPPPVRRTSELSNYDAVGAATSEPASPQPVPLQPETVPETVAEGSGSDPAEQPVVQHKKPPPPPARSDTLTSRLTSSKLASTPPAKDVSTTPGAAESAGPADSAEPAPPAPATSVRPGEANSTIAAFEPPSVIGQPEGEYAVPIDEDDDESEAATTLLADSETDKGPPPPVPKRQSRVQVEPVPDATPDSRPLPPRPGKKPMAIPDDAGDDDGAAELPRAQPKRPPPMPPPGTTTLDVVDSDAHEADVAGADVTAVDADDDADDEPEAGPTVYCAPPSAVKRRPPTDGYEVGDNGSDPSASPPPDRPQLPSRVTPDRPPKAAPVADPADNDALEDDNFGYTVDEDVYEPIDQHFRGRTDTQKARLIAGEEQLLVVQEEDIYDSIPGDMPADDAGADYSGASLGAGAAPPPVPAPYQPQEVAPVVPPPVARWWPGKKKSASAPQEYVSFISRFVGSVDALMTVTATKLAPNKAYAELPFDLGEVIEIIQVGALCTCLAHCVWLYRGLSRTLVPYSCLGSSALLSSIVSHDSPPLPVSCRWMSARRENGSDDRLPQGITGL
jgi:hypothetical protein